MAQFFTLNIQTYPERLAAPDAAELIARLRRNYFGAKAALDEDGQPQKESAWQDYAAQLAEFSRQYPNRLFTLEGEGRGPHQYWRLYVVDGKSQLSKVVMTLAPFDPAQLV